MLLIAVTDSFHLQQEAPDIRKMQNCQKRVFLHNLLITFRYLYLRNPHDNCHKI